MAAQQGTILYREDEENVHFHVAGWGTMNMSLPLRRFVEQLLSTRPRNVWIDLRRCTYVDSTFLGTFLFLQRAVARHGCGLFRLVSPSPECTCLFQQMGVEEVFNIVVTEEPATAGWTPLTKEPADQNCFQRNVLQAHEELAALPGSAGEPFRAVVRCLAKDMENK